MVVSHQHLPEKVELVKRILSTMVLPSPVPYRSVLRRFAVLSSKGCAEVALRAQQLLEDSLLADLRAVVARALSGLDMFADTDGQLLSPTSAAAAAVMSPFTTQPSALDSARSFFGGPGAVVPRKQTIREGVFTGLNSLMHNSRSGSPTRNSSIGGPMAPHVEHKIETLVAAPAAVEEALASLIVDHEDRALQYRALLTYVKRIYHPFLLGEPRVQDGKAGMMTAVWIYNEPRLANTPQYRHQAGAFLVLPNLSELRNGLITVAQAVAGLGMEAQGGVLHVAVNGKMSNTANRSTFCMEDIVTSVLSATSCRQWHVSSQGVDPGVGHSECHLFDVFSTSGLRLSCHGCRILLQCIPSVCVSYVFLDVPVGTGDCLQLSESAAQLLAKEGGLLGSDNNVTSSHELIASEGTATATPHHPQQVTQIVAAALADLQDTLRTMQIGFVSVLAPGASTMPLRNGFKWNETMSSFRHDPFLRQVSLLTAYGVFWS